MNDRNFHSNIWKPVPSQVPTVCQIKPPPPCDMWSTALTGTGSENVIKTGQKDLRLQTETARTLGIHGPSHTPCSGLNKNYSEIFVPFSLHHINKWMKMWKYGSFLSHPICRCSKFLPEKYMTQIIRHQSVSYQILILITESAYLQNLLAMFKYQKNNSVSWLCCAHKGVTCSHHHANLATWVPAGHWPPGLASVGAGSEQRYFSPVFLFLNKTSAWETHCL